MYAENGWMSVQIAGAAPGTISRADFIKLPAADRVVWLDEYYAYYGTFEIDEVARVVTHHVVRRHKDDAGLRRYGRGDSFSGAGSQLQSDGQRELEVKPD